MTEDHKMADDEDEEERAMIEATDRALQEDEAMDELIEEMKEATEEDDWLSIANRILLILRIFHTLLTIFTHF